jgi:hypothetical protein
MNVEVRRDRGVNGVKELAELHGTMAAMTATDAAAAACDPTPGSATSRPCTARGRDPAGPGTSHDIPHLLYKRGGPATGRQTDSATCRTVCLVNRSSRATRVFVRPLAHASTIRARCANACAVVGRRARRSSLSCSSSPSVSTAIGRPMAIGVLLSIARTLDTDKLFHLVQTHETLAD